MNLLEADENNHFSFAPFAIQPFYTTVNRSLVQQALAGITRPRGTPLTIVDLACGTGAVTRLIAEEVARQGRQARILGVDPSAEARFVLPSKRWQAWEREYAPSSSRETRMISSLWSMMLMPPFSVMRFTC